MKNNLFDTIFKEKLQDYQSTVPTGLWEKIVQENDRKKVLPFWRNSTIGIVIIVALIGVVLSIYSPLEKQSNSIITSKTNSVNKKIIPLTKLNAAKNIDKTSNNPLSQTNKITKENKEALEATIATTAQKTKQTYIKNNFSIKKQKNSITEHLLTNPVAKNNHFEEIVNTFTQTKNNTTLLENMLSSSTESIEEPTTNYMFTKADIVASPLKKYTVKNLQNIQLKNSKTVKICLACPGEKFNNWHVAAIGSVDFTSKIVTANGVNSAFLQGKDSTETMNGGFTLGVRISRNFGEKFYLKSGLQYTQVNEKLTRTIENERRITTVINVRTIIRAPGDTLYVRDTTSATQISYINKASNNTYKSIEIPLLATFESGNESWKFGVTGGIVTNLTSWYKGETFDSTNQLIPLGQNKGTNGFYKSNVNFSIYGSVSVFKRLDENFELFVEPYGKFSLSNNNTSSIGYNKRFNVVGVFFGLRYKVPSRHKKM